MKGKILFVAGLGVGYVLGTRAGRERYEQIKRATAKLWENPAVQKQVTHAEDFVKDKAPEVAGLIADGAKKLVGQVASLTGDRKKAVPSAKKSAVAHPATADSE
jgi:hypothetical protein